MPGSLPTTRVYQLYRDAIHPGELDAALAQIAANDPGAMVAWHGFPSELPAHFDALVARAASHGITSGAAFGLDSPHVSPEAKGAAIGDVASRQNCVLTLIDCESYWDESKAGEMRQMGDAARAKAPDAPMIAQPWPEPLMHSGFPYEEENAFCDGNAPQYYYNDWKAALGPHRVAHLRPIFDEQWSKLNAGRLASCVRPMSITIQAEGWDDVLPDLVTELCRLLGEIVWCDKGFPRSPTWWRGIAAARALAAHSITGADAVARFQASAGLTVDGIAGPKTLAALGVT